MPAGVRLDEKSAASCALTTWDERVHLAWTGTDLHLNLAAWPDGRGLVGKQRLAQRSYRYESERSFGEDRRKIVAMSPSLVGSGERLWLAWTGSNGALNVLAADRGGPFAPMALKQRSTRSPSLTTAQDGTVVLAWTGTDRHLNLLTVRTDWSREPVRLDAKSSAAPAVCSHGGDLVLAWTGSDTRLNLARLR
jgi:hypothetical protein